ncbi:MAG: hypothetical protein ACREBG_01620 [Pyrinomonadaceae bacterium]
MAFADFDARFMTIDHSMQVGSCPFDVEMLVLPGAAFGRKHSAPVDIFKVAVRKFIVTLGILRLLVVDSQVPAAIFLKAMLANELVLLLVASLNVVFPFTPTRYEVNRSTSIQTNHRFFLRRPRPAMEDKGVGPRLCPQVGED